MKIGVIGLPQVGKKTLFELLTGEKIASAPGKVEVKMGIVKIRDPRFDQLVAIYQPVKSVPAAIDIVLLPKFDKETVQSGEFVKSLEKCDALCHIVRAFSDESIFHVDGKVDALRDIENVFSELVLGDLILVEKRLERIEKEAKFKSSPATAREKEILLKMKEVLDQNKLLNNFTLNDEDKKMMSTYQFLTRKPFIIVLNVDEGKVADPKLLDQVNQKYQGLDIKTMQVSAKIEAELAALDAREQEAFLQDLNIKESALHQLTRLCYETLGLISFFTVGKDEVRAWTTKRNSLAPEAAGAIHSDIQRGFIRAEIMQCADLIAMGSESKVKEAGKFMLKGKDYVVQDGDIMHVRFNV
jgi:GTP-binding protein YchF